jgi:hypothetical protein
MGLEVFGKGKRNEGKYISKNPHVEKNMGKLKNNYSYEL